MSRLTITDMRRYLSRSISSFNANKFRGLMAEIDLRNHLAALGFAERISMGGWIARSEARGGNRFGEHTVALFPEHVQPDVEYPPDRQLPSPDLGLHTICATFHQLGIRSYFCAPRIRIANEPESLDWYAIQLGLPRMQPYQPLSDAATGFTPRARTYNFLKWNAQMDPLPDATVPEEFSKENLRVSFQTRFMAEISDIDGLFWGQNRTYPLEIKEKTVANEAGVGDYFGLDVGPFVKLAFYAAKRGNLHSLFIVREINDVEERRLINWWYVTFDTLAQYASWVFTSGGTPMGGAGRSATVKIPKSAFSPLDAAALESL